MNNLVSKEQSNAYESLTSDKFRGSKEELVCKIEHKLKDITLKSWNKSRLKFLKENLLEQS